MICHLDKSLSSWRPDGDGFIDHEYAFNPTGSSLTVFWVLRALGEDVWGNYDSWTWNLGVDGEIEFALDWGIDGPIIRAYAHGEEENA